MPTRNKYLRKKYSSRAYKRSRRFEHIEKLTIHIAAVVVIIFVAIFLKTSITDKKKKVNIPIETVEAFQIPHKTFLELQTVSQKYNLNFSEILTIYCLECNFFPTKTIAPDISDLEQNFIANYDAIKGEYTKKDITPYFEIFSTLLSELKYFPIPDHYDTDETISYMFGDSWGSDRVCDDGKVHRGTDIYDRESIRGRIPVVSMTDGVIKDIGWTDSGGFRIGIETVNSTYYYYAHLDHFAENISQGMTVQAGQFLGYMGNTGFGEKNKTTEHFQVQLHIGISPKTTLTKKQFNMNPYAFLRLIESNKVNL